MKILRAVYIFAAPWITLGYAWQYGFRWTLIGLGCVYGSSFAIAIAITIDRELRPHESDAEPSA